MSKRSYLRSWLNPVDDIPTTEYIPNNNERRDRLSMANIHEKPPEIPERKTQSFGAGGKIPMSPTKTFSISVIDETQETVVFRDKEPDAPKFKRNRTSQSSATVNPNRKRKAPISPAPQAVGIDNNAFVPSRPPSRPPSMHGGESVTNLSVIREQYCCFNRWTKREKYLFITVLAMGFIIIGLLFTVGNLADAQHGTQKPMLVSFDH